MLISISNSQKILIHKIINYADIFFSLYALVSTVFLIGFYLNDWWFNFFSYSVNLIIAAFLVSRLINLVIALDLLLYVKDKWFEYLMAFLLLGQMVFGVLDTSVWGTILPGFEVKQLMIINLAVVNLFLFFSNVVSLLRYNYLIARLQLNPATIFAISFLLIILIGSLFLMMPRATYLEHKIRYIDALFTATSAVCVTGLVSVDPAVTFTPLGKLIVISLIQVGGLGVMSITSLFAAFFAGGLSVKARILMKEALSNASISNIKSLVAKIIFYTLAIEFIGSLFLFKYLGGSFLNFDVNLYYNAAFHAISAFCNAGFSVYSTNLMDTNVCNPGFLYTICVLITLGGLGFAVLVDITNFINPFTPSKPKGLKLQLTTKIVLVTTLSLTFGGAIFFYFWEYQNYVPIGRQTWMSDLSYANYQNKLNIAHSMLLSVTCRTAGFTSTPPELLSYPTVFLMIFLMFVGASPASTGGGIKTTTFAFAIVSVKNLVLGKQRVELFNREISREVVIKSFKIIVIALLLVFIGSFLIIMFEPDKRPIDIVFEVTSAFGTVGLSRNLTGLMSDASKIVLISLMFIGRIGVINFLTSFYTPKPEPRYRLPIEEINVG